MKVAVVGAGSWGSAIYKILFLAGHDVSIWARREEVAQALKRGENPYYLPGVSLPKGGKVSTDPSVIEDSEMVVFAVPAQHVREILGKFKRFLRGKIVVNLAKGIEVSSGKRMEEVYREVLGDAEYATLSGPSHAEEVARDAPTSVVVASRSEGVARKVQETFSTPTFRVYRSDDVTGVEIAGALKNVIAIAAGAIDGLGGWDNSKAALITRGLAEMTRFGERFGARKETFMGLAGIGDLVVTCTSRHSRNRKVGEMIARGMSLEEALRELRMVAEGVHTVRIVWRIAQEENIYMPITEHVYKVLYEGMEMREALHSLMNRPLKREY